MAVGVAVDVAVAGYSHNAGLVNKSNRLIKCGDIFV
jgi:hypothetical protein